MSNRSRVHKTHALILRRRDFGDADRVLTVYTPSDGKQQYIARGIRKMTSRKAGHLETFSHASLLVAEGRTWDIITEASTVESFRHLRQDLEQIGRASYVCELVDRFTEMDDENRDVWELVIGVLRLLDVASQNDTGNIEADFDANLLLRWFELHLLLLTGFQPQLFHCVQCEAEIQPEQNYLGLQSGGVFCPKCGIHLPEAEAIDVETLKILRHIQRSGWNEIRHLKLDDKLMRKVESILYRYLLIVLERRLISVDFLHRLQSLTIRSE